MYHIDVYLSITAFTPYSSPGNSHQLDKCMDDFSCSINGFDVSVKSPPSPGAFKTKPDHHIRFSNRGSNQNDLL